MVKVGDLIRCNDLEDLTRKMNALLNDGIDTEFHFPMDKHDFVLEVTNIHQSIDGGAPCG